MKTISVERLAFDANNPRLPEDMLNASQEEIFRFFYKHGVLDELVDSLLDNGYFAHEPLIVLPSGEAGRHIVVEGNRRLAALFLVHFHRVVGDARPVRDPTEEELARLQEINCFEVESREDVRGFLGFRHISGLRPWRPEAKARYLRSEVEKAAAAGEERPFLAVARRVGSNVVGVRSAYIALSLLHHARSECGADVSYVLSDRFGVWLRCMNSPDIRAYFGFELANQRREVVAAVRNVDCEKLGEVVSDLTPGEGTRRAVLADSRDVTQYGLVLANDTARRMLRHFGDLEIAKHVVEAAGFPDRISELKSRVDAIREEITDVLTERSPELEAQTEALLRSVKLLLGIVTALSEAEA